MNVSLREKQSRKRVTLFLDYRVNGKRYREFIGITYRAGNREEKKNSLLLAENIRMKRQLEIQSEDHGFDAPFKRDADFIEYFVAASQEA